MEGTAESRAVQALNSLKNRYVAPHAQLLGRWVRVRGWMLFDRQHQAESENTNPGQPHNSRATAWEIHPVTSIGVVPGPQ